MSIRWTSRPRPAPPDSRLGAEHREALLRLVGAAGLLEDPADLRPYETAARYGRTTAEVPAVLRHCVAHRLAYTPQSGNTGLVLGSTPDAGGRELVLSLDRLRTAPRIDVPDRTVQVAAGVRLSALNAALEPHELFLPIDVSSDPMIGGMVATNTGGARFLRYGDMRRQVLGLEVVLPDEAGTVLQLSNGLRKDNAHLDLRQLFIGSCGAFGIITAATLEVRPRPRQTAVALLVPRDEDAVLDLLAAVEREAGEFLSAFEGMSEAAMRHAIAHVPTLRNPFPDGLPPYAVLVELSCTAPPRCGETTLDGMLEACATSAMWPTAVFTSTWCSASLGPLHRVGSRPCPTTCWILQSVILVQPSAVNMALAARTNTPMISTYRQRFSSMRRPLPRYSPVCRPLRSALDRRIAQE